MSNRFNASASCPVCSDVFSELETVNRLPLVLSCGHHICSSCHQNLVTSNSPLPPSSSAPSPTTLSCPTCQKVVQGGSKDTKIAEAVKVMSQAQQQQAGTGHELSTQDADNICERCNVAKSVYWCLGCNMFFCDKCDSDHHVGPKLTPHKRVSPRLRNLYTVPTCKLHFEKVTHFCQSCKEGICSECRDTKSAHGTHTLEAVGDVRADLTTQARSRLDDAIRRFHKYDDMNTVEDRIRSDIRRWIAHMEDGLRRFETEVGQDTNKHALANSGTLNSLKEATSRYESHLFAARFLIQPLITPPSNLPNRIHSASAVVQLQCALDILATADAIEQKELDSYYKSVPPIDFHSSIALFAEMRRLSLSCPLSITPKTLYLANAVSVLHFSNGDAKSPTSDTIVASAAAVGRSVTVKQLRGDVVPPLSDVSESVILVSAYDNINGATIGDLLADCIEKGKNVVVVLYANSSSYAYPQSRFSPYAPLTPSADDDSHSTFTVDKPDHPLCSGVTTLRAGSDVRRAVTSVAAGDVTVVATWSDSKPLAAIRNDAPGLVTSIGLQFGSSGSPETRILVNALCLSRVA